MPEKVSANNFQLVDANGKKRAELSLLKDGNPALAFYDKEGKCLADLSVDDGSGQAGLSLYGKNGKPGTLLMASHLNLFNEDGSGQIRLAVMDGQRPAALDFWDKNGKRRMTLDMEPDGSYRLMLNDSDERVVWKTP